MWAGGGAECGLQVDGLVKKPVTEEDHQREEAELEVISFDRRFCFVSTDNEEREEDGEQAPADDIR